MKKILCLFVMFFILVLMVTSIYRGVNLSKQFDRFTLADFNIIGIIINGIEKKYEEGTNEYELFCILFSDMQQLTGPEDMRLRKGESKKAIRIILYNDTQILFKLFLGYALKRNIISIQIANKNNFSITRYYFVEPEIAETFFNSIAEVSIK